VLEILKLPESMFNRNLPRQRAANLLSLLDTLIIHLVPQNDAPGVQGQVTTPHLYYYLGSTSRLHKYAWPRGKKPSMSNRKLILQCHIQYCVPAGTSSSPTWYPNMMQLRGRYNSHA